MSDFRDLDEAGERLAAHEGLNGLVGFDVVAVIPRGVPVAVHVAARLGVDRAQVIGAVRSDTGGAEPEFTLDRDPGPRVVVVDDGVETGTAASALARLLRGGQIDRLVLAVPVCPREVEPALRMVYDDVVSVVRPLARRSLHWHYSDFPAMHEGQARLLLAQQDPSHG
jgi:predicted phosphoribosyltransferase